MVVIIVMLIIIVLIILLVTNKNGNSISRKIKTRNAINEKKNRHIYYLRYDTDKYTQPTEPYTTTIEGVIFENRIAVCDGCTKGEELMLAREPDNEYDPNAVMVLKFTGEVLGYLSQTDAEIYAPLIDNRVLLKTYFSFLNYLDDWYDAYIDIIEFKEP